MSFYRMVIAIISLWIRLQIKQKGAHNKTSTYILTCGKHCNIVNKEIIVKIKSPSDQLHYLQKKILVYYESS